MLKGDLQADEKRWLSLDANSVLGLGLSATWHKVASRVDVPEIEALTTERRAARAAGDYGASMRCAIGFARWASTSSTETISARFATG
ncbi:hypothetical protein BH24CHL5_BH24CHL5_02930 [soil metagenome]